MLQIKLALDWTPNTNHIGFFVAKELRLYEQEGIELQIINPKDDNYQVTPGKKLELDMVDFAIAPSETVISLNNKERKVDAVAVFAILQEDLSCIVTLATSKITSPKYLDGKIYASYKARYEDHIVRQMVRNDGGRGDLTIVYPDKLGIWNTLLEGKADATWIFDNWEGVEAATRAVALNKFRMSDYQIPYGYSPVVLTKKENLMRKKEAYTNFLKATKKGFLLAKENANQAISILKNYLTEHDITNIDLAKSLSMTAPYFGDEQTCGMMKQERVSS
ncbi:MAG: ABC transporter substrate-binding protein, partial [Flammeovirgaceae bacterium]|nr:ABC transporter substrate-binding protein [Flammeovirgaceae bacterium]MDW8287907.1 ABC transporter substrate-binding protein [Flammeovirgaceae bacterium]